MTTNLHRMALFNEKENVESGSTRRRGGLNLFKPKASIAQQHKSSTGLLGLTTVKGFEEVLTKDFSQLEPLSQLEMNVLEKGGARPDVSIGRICAEDGSGLAAASVKGSRSLHLMRKQLEHPLEETDCSEQDCSQILNEQPLTVLAQERMQETSWGAVSTCSASLIAHLCNAESTKAPLLNEFDERSESEIRCDWLKPADPILPSLLQIPCEKPRQCSETDNIIEIQCDERIPFEVPDCLMPPPHHNPNTDHVVVFFSVQKCLKHEASRVNKQKLLKLASLCSLYSRKVMHWVTEKCTEQNFSNCLRRMRQLFSPSASRFTRLDNQKLPEFSTKVSSPSKKALAKDKELRAVLLKINEVLASMETASSDNMQVIVD
ncbi:hypothetical protein L7F22_008856 [Adiantum nelumboides]|nr:hypothetical protein [Adiantum nelumboides]